MTQATQNQSEKKGSKPTHIVYVKTYVNKQAINVKVGAAWKHSKGNGFNISLNDMVVFENKPKDKTKS